MAVEPEKFFVGVIDFFSVLLPGALFTYLLRDELSAVALGGRMPSDIEGWSVFAVASYLFGHFIFLAGSWLLDDCVYDPARDATYRRQIKRLSCGKKLPPRPLRWFAALMFEDDIDKAVTLAQRIKEHHLDGTAADAINAFQWVKATLNMSHPAAIAEVHRFEADSKFFRSLIIVLLLVGGIYLARGQLALGALAAVLLVFATARYVEQRGKATDQAYRYIITSEAQREDGFRASDVRPAASRAGGVVIRQAGDGHEVLLVTASRSRDLWVLPKGHVEPLETTAEAAVREVREEAGVWARVEDELGPIEYHLSSGELVDVVFYLMSFVEQRRPQERRECKWQPLHVARRMLPPESAVLLDAATQSITDREVRRAFA